MPERDAPLELPARGAIEVDGLCFRYGLDTRVQERGSRLSAGEKQLVSLCRALRDPAVLVLDEATSSLDPGTEQLVEGAMQRLMKDRTVIVIAAVQARATRSPSLAALAAKLFGA